MKRTIYKITTVLLVASFVAIGSCSDDFVDVASQDENSDEYFNSEEDYQKALLGAYDLLQTTFANVIVGEIASDNTVCGGAGPTDVPGWHEIDDMTHTPVNANLRDIWGWMFAGVNRVNFIMEYQDKTEFTGKNEVLAQARFLRAYFYFELVKWFGDVPLSVDKRIQFGEQFSIERTPKSEIYAQIELDLQFAAANLPEVQSEAGRVTKGAANALLGKAYLFQDNFPEAAQAFDKVIAGPYDLVEDYATIFEHEGENEIESVFEVQYTDKEGASFECFVCSEGNIAVGFSGIKTYTGPEFDSGYGFNLPTQEMVDQFEEGDLRKDVAILDIDQWSADNDATFVMSYQQTGYYNRKYIPRKGDLNIGDENLTNPNNYRAIRFADVLLMAAEAYNRGGLGDNVALEYLNRVRARAFGDTDHAISVTGTNLTQAIYHERRVELVGEGHRFFDLVRTGRAAQEISGFSTGKNEVFPIPSIEIDLAGGRWSQNPGY
jgi:hypothetical protein